MTVRFAIISVVVLLGSMSAPDTAGANAVVVVVRVVVVRVVVVGPEGAHVHGRDFRRLQLVIPELLIKNHVLQLAHTRTKLVQEP